MYGHYISLSTYALMTLKINKVYLSLTLVILLIEICIAAFLTEGFIRHTFGDYLVVILMYGLIRSFVSIKPIYPAAFVVLFAFMIEFLQMVDLLDVLNLRSSRLATIILGSTFQVTDLIAYLLGVLTIYLIDSKFKLPWNF
ncbi:MAG: hypothetical protein ACJAZK_002496 [Psychroserpens sp.]|jgi:hypothetical protein